MKNKKEQIRNLLAEFLGVEPSDISDEDSLVNDLQVKPVELADFLKTLEEAGLNTAKLDLAEIDTFDELVENLVYDEYVE